MISKGLSSLFPQLCFLGSCVGPVNAKCIVHLGTRVQGIPLQHGVGYLSKDN